jgi:hypothetical protein
VDKQSFPFPTIFSPLAYKVITGSMQPFSFLLFIASLAFALPAKSVEHRLLTPDNFSKTIAKGYW